MIPMRSAWVRLPAILLLVAATAGCDALQPGASGASRPADPEHAQAQDALARWADAAAKSGGSLISFVGDQTGMIGSFEPAVGDNAKRALLAGLFVAAAWTSTSSPPRTRSTT
jgi:hypothetical protein